MAGNTNICPRCKCPLYHHVDDDMSSCPNIYCNSGYFIIYSDFGTMSQFNIGEFVIVIERIGTDKQQVYLYVEEINADPPSRPYFQYLKNNLKQICLLANDIDLENLTENKLKLYTLMS